jgi:hypothetical protein
MWVSAPREASPQNPVERGRAGRDRVMEGRITRSPPLPGPNLSRTGDRVIQGTLYYEPHFCVWTHLDLIAHMTLTINIDVCFGIVSLDT